MRKIRLASLVLALAILMAVGCDSEPFPELKSGNVVTFAKGEVSIKFEILDAQPDILHWRRYDNGNTVDQDGTGNPATIEITYDNINIGSFRYQSYWYVVLSDKSWILTLN